MDDKTPLRHMALFWLKRPDDPGHKAKLIEGLQSLAAIPQVRTLHIGLPAPTDAREVVDHSWTVSESMTFESLADQAAYQSHPIHQAFVTNCSSLWDRVVVYDIVDAIEPAPVRANAPITDSR